MVIGGIAGLVDVFVVTIRKLVCPPFHPAILLSQLQYVSPSPTLQWTRRPLPATGDSPPDLVRHHSLAQSFPHIPAVIPLLNLLISIASPPPTSSSSLKENLVHGLPSRSTAAQSRQSRCLRSLRRKISRVCWNSLQREVIRYRPSRQRCVLLVERVFLS